MKIFVLLLFLLVTAQSASAQCKLTRNLTLPSGSAGLCMENERLLLHFDPMQGATCVKFLDKQTGVQFTTGQGGLHLFTDRLLEIAYSVLPGLPYETKILLDTPDEISVEFSRDAAPGYQYLTFRRRITLRRGDGTVHVEYDIHNGTGSMAPVVITPYFRHGVSVPGKSTGFHTPTAKSLETRWNVKGGENKGNVFFRDVTSGYAAIDDDAGNGLGFEFDFSRLDYVYNWLAGMNQSTLEWAFFPIRIECGGTFTTSCRLTPYSGITRPLAIKNGIAGGIHGDKILLSPAVSGEYLLRLNDKDCGFVALKAGQNHEFAIPDINREATTVELLSESKTVFKLFCPHKEGILFPAECPKVKAAEIEVQELKLSMEKTTPHTPWARPHINGAPELLILCDLQQQREVVELAQRLECKFTVIRISHISSQMAWGMVERFGSFSFKDANAALRQSLKKKYDAILVSGNLWKFLEQDNLQGIKRQLETGAGLIMLAPSELPPEMQKLQVLKMAARPETLQGEWIASSHLAARGWTPELSQPGKHYRSELLPGTTNLITSVNGPVFACGTPQGIRVVQTAYFTNGGILPAFPLEKKLPEYSTLDYQFVPIIKAILLAAGRLPETVVSASLLDHAFRAEVRGPVQANEMLEITFRCLLTGEKSVERIPVPARDGGGSLIDLPRPSVPGICTAEYILRSDGKTVDFGTAARLVTSRPAIYSIKLTPPALGYYQAGDSILGTVNLSGPAEKVELSLTDTEERLISRASADSQGGFSLEVPEASTRLMRVTAFVWANGILQDKRSEDIFVKVRPAIPDYMITASEHEWMWDINRQLRPYFFKELRKETGFDVMRLWTLMTPERGEPAYKDYLRFGFELILPVTGNQKLHSFVENFQKPYNETKDKKYLARNPCFHDPAFIEKNEQKILTQLKRLEPYSPTQLSYGDEHSLTLFSRELDFCWSQHSLQKFREHLKKMYDSLQALNEQWDTAFATWDEVVPKTTEEIRASAKQSGNYSQWVDFRDFMDAAFSGYYASSSEIIRKAGCNLEIDLSGCEGGNSYNGMQWYRFAPALQQCAPYRGGSILELIRSFGPQRVVPWNTGYAHQGPIVFYHVWHDAFCFKQGGSSFYSSRNMLYPDYTLQPGARDYANATYDLRSGLGAVRATLDEEPAEVLLHFSQASLYAAQITRDYGSYMDARKAWIALLNDLHLNFRFIASDELEKGVLRATSARAVVLPMSRALSAKECEELRLFVRNGGILVADRLAAIMDEHGRKLPDGQLNELFGLSQNDSGPSEEQSVMFGTHSVQCRIGKARNKQNEQALLANTFGKGQSTYLNFTIGNYAGMRFMQEKKSEAEVMRNVLLNALGGRKLARYSVTEKDGCPVGARIFSYCQASAPDALFLGLVREERATGESSICLTFDKPAYLCDLRKGTLTQNKTTHHTLTLAPAEAAFLALLPERPIIPEITAAATVNRGELFSYGVKVPHSSMEHAFEIIVTTPQGEKHRLYSSVVRGKRGLYTGQFRTALNEQPGQWILSARDPFSNKIVKHPFSIR